MTIGLALLICEFAAVSLASSGDASNDLAGLRTAGKVHAVPRQCATCQAPAMRLDPAGPRRDGHSVGWGSMAPVPNRASAAWGSVAGRGASGITAEN